MMPSYVQGWEKIWHYVLRVIAGLVLFYLIFPIFVIVPLSFNALPYFVFTEEMLSLDPAGYSLQWYKDFFTDINWQTAVKNSVIISLFSTLLATFLGTLAALGLSRSYLPFRRAIMAMLISPMIVPLIISAAAMFFFYSSINLQGTYVGVILAHTALATPFVVITVTATLSNFDYSLVRASHSLGASPTTTFFRIIVPIIFPGVISGALFAFITSFDEVVVILFVGSYEQHTIPWQMFSGIRERISPTILAVATILIFLSILLLLATELLRRRTERLRGITGV
ncbi:ABC transporter permease [Candidatus Persebacteraceae bacterium Df01]|jgi:putative spermidine/putrescine transport system permease protein|uniref:ABC transporter permease n=1 Tax=Candidatus Doriopsillibacter californiensis TaxID=2970740 RepID=A0ABT7QLF4_9GAMM|nr:ABC transporter permease [Candidatus Persebacteraceae bacterium Df01]